MEAVNARLKMQIHREIGGESDRQRTPENANTEKDRGGETSRLRRHRQERQGKRQAEKEPQAAGYVHKVVSGQKGRQDLG